MLVELVATGLAAETMEQKLKAEVTECQAEEGLAHKIVHGQRDVFKDLNNELLAIQGAMAVSQAVTVFRPLMSRYTTQQS